MRSVRGQCAFSVRSQHNILMFEDKAERVDCVEENQLEISFCFTAFAELTGSLTFKVVSGLRFSHVH